LYNDSCAIANTDEIGIKQYLLTARNHNLMWHRYVHSNDPKSSYASLSETNWPFYILPM
jgi:hypothetical protein